MDHLLARAAATLPGAVSDFRRDVARITVAELNAAARRIRADLDILQQHQQTAYQSDVAAILGELAYQLGTYRDCPALHFGQMSDSEWAEELMVLGGELRTRAPRKWSAILRSVRLDAKRCVIWFALEPEPVCPLSLDTEAA
jgi:hypothetical protein